MSTPSSLRQHQVSSGVGGKGRLGGGATTPLSSSSSRVVTPGGLRSPNGVGGMGGGIGNISTKQGEYTQMVKELRGLMAQEKQLVLGSFSADNNNDDDRDEKSTQPPPTVVSAKVPLQSVSSFVSNIELRTQHSPNEGLLGVSIFDEGGLQITAAGELDDGTGSAVGALSRIFQLCQLMENPVLPSSTSVNSSGPLLHKVFASSPPEKGPEQLGEEVWASDVILRTEQALQTPLPISPSKTRSELHSVVIEIYSGGVGDGTTSSGVMKRSSSTSKIDNNASFAKPNVGNDLVGPQSPLGGSGSGSAKGRVICLAPCTNDLVPNREDIDTAIKALQRGESSNATTDTSLNTRAMYEAQCVIEKTARRKLERLLDECSRHQREVLNSMAFVCGRAEKAVSAMEVLHHRQGLARTIHSSLVAQSKSPQGSDAAMNTENLVLATVHSGGGGLASYT